MRKWRNALGTYFLSMETKHGEMDGFFSPLPPNDVFGNLVSIQRTPELGIHIEDIAIQPLLRHSHASAGYEAIHTC